MMTDDDLYDIYLDEYERSRKWFLHMRVMMGLVLIIDSALTILDHVYHRSLTFDLIGVAICIGTLIWLAKRRL